MSVLDLQCPEVGPIVRPSPPSQSPPPKLHDMLVSAPGEELYLAFVRSKRQLSRPASTASLHRRVAHSLAATPSSSSLHACAGGGAAAYAPAAAGTVVDLLSRSLQAVAVATEAENGKPQARVTIDATGTALTTSGEQNEFVRVSVDVSLLSQ